MSNLAHIRQMPDGEERLQTCEAHMRNAAKYAGETLAPVGLGSCAYLAALLHDMGKLKRSYQDYLRCSADGEKIQRGLVVHTFAGVRFLLKRYHTEERMVTHPYDAIASEMLAYAIGAHHGLFDCVNESHESGFLHRLTNLPEGDEAATDCFLSECAELGELDTLFEKSVKELVPVIRQCAELDPNDDGNEQVFMIGLVTRLLASAVMEGDRRDTAEFMSDASFPNPADGALWARLLQNVEAKLGQLDSSTPINKARQTISQRCRAAAEKAPGVYRLNLPTGGGKTLSSLRYALAHAEKYGKKRIIMTSPLLSILEQNSEVVRRYVQDDSVILEHHSNLVIEEGTSEEEVHELLVDSWSSPIIITTLVQLLNTMFLGKTSSVRRFHALTDAVIVIDEVQTVPNKLLTLFNLTVTFLAECCHSTVILCSATQPCLEPLRHPIRTRVEELIPYDASLWEVFKRTEIKNAGALPFEEIPTFAESLLQKEESLLIVCNKKSESELLGKAMEGENREVFHLSAAMCTAHRRKTLNELYKALENSKQTSRKVVCVSTQVIEAGVDISFGAVIRLTAGMDSVVQSAGRCNRHGEKSLSPVYVLRAEDENLSRLPEIEMAKKATEDLLHRYKESPEAFQGDLASDQAIRQYYKKLFSLQQSEMPIYHDYPNKHMPSLFSLLSWNDGWMGTDDAVASFTLRQAFKSAGSLFSVFDSNTTDVIVPYGEGEEIITALLSERALKDLTYAKALLEKAKSYTVSLYSYQRKALEERHGLIPLAGGIALGLTKDYYHPQTGLTITKEQEETNACNTLIW